VALAVGALFILMSIPKQAWITVGLIALVGLAIYLYAKHKSSPASPQPKVNSPPLTYPLKPAPITANTKDAEPAFMPLGHLPLPSNAPGPDTSPLSKKVVEVEPVPVSMMPAQPPPSSYRVPAAPSGYGQASWIPDGHCVNVSGVTLPGGMLYVGTVLKTPHGDSDPCLIDPSKTVASKGNFVERETNYWPSYSEISASARRAYLNWLSEGRNHPDADIGYVFLFFYGLERRAVIDAAKNPKAQADWPCIAQELRRLLRIYGEKSSSFRDYANQLLNWVELANHPAKLYTEPVPEFTRSWELPLYLRLALGQAAIDAVPVPVHLALAWARLEPATCLRTPATRCPDEFATLFEQKYLEAFGAGIALPRNKTKLKFVYRPASTSFHGHQEIKLTFGDTPDVTVLTGPVNKLRQVVEAATKELDAYSRYLARNPGANASLEGLLQLPPTLWPKSAQGVMDSLKTRMGQGMLVITFQEVLSMLEARTALTRDKVRGLACAFESMNIAIEPDVLGGAKPPKPEDKVVLFAVPPGEPILRSIPAYQAALLTLQLSSAVAMADGEFTASEMRYLRLQIQSWTHLAPGYHRRLLAHLRLLRDAPVSLSSLKKKLEPLDIPAKEAIAMFMATVAQADGTVSPAEMKMLEKVYKTLGIDSKKVFSDVHAVAAGISAGTPMPGEKPAEAGFRLDPARITALQQDTEKVSALLANIFREDERNTEPLAPLTAVLTGDAESDEATAPEGLLGLDEAHSALARMLLSRPQWSRTELLDIAASLNVMLDGALERINEASFDAHDMSFTEGDDPIEVSAEVLEKIEA